MRYRRPIDCACTPNARRAGRFEAPEAVDRSPGDADPLWLLHARRSGFIG